MEYSYTLALNMTRLIYALLGYSLHSGAAQTVDVVQPTPGTGLEIFDDYNIQCLGDGSMTVTIGLPADELGIDRYIDSVVIGECPFIAEDYDLITTQGEGTIFTITFNPFTCGVTDTRNPAKIDSSYSTSINSTFDLTIRDQNSVLVVNTFHIVLKCEYADMYKVSSDGKYVGNLDFEEEQLGNITAAGMEFELTIYSDEGFSVEAEDFPTKAGSMLYYGVKPIIENSTFDPNTMLFAPKRCIFHQKNSDLSYTMFTMDMDSTAPQQCKNTPIKLDVSYDFETRESPEWFFEHILFLFSGGQAEYVLTCDVVVCDKSMSNTECTHTMDMCVPSVEEEVI